jgi:hypothetical protein
MLIGCINLTVNVLIVALPGLASVFVFTRLFSPHDYRVDPLGVAFVWVIGVVLVRAEGCHDLLGKLARAAQCIELADLFQEGRQSSNSLRSL